MKKIAIVLALLMALLMASGCKSQDQIDAQQQVVAAAENAYYYDTRSTINVTGKGEVVLYGVSPHHRHQTHTTFKLLFNALYK